MKTVDNVLNVLYYKYKKNNKYNLSAVMKMINNNLKLIRTNKQISISDLSRKTGISERYLRFIESGEKNPSLKTAQRIAVALETTTDDIFLS